jgi:hypothetical protein
MLGKVEPHDQQAKVQTQDFQLQLLPSASSQAAPLECGPGTLLQKQQMQVPGPCPLPTESKPLGRGKNLDFSPVL